MQLVTMRLDPFAAEMVRVLGPANPKKIFGLYPRKGMITSGSGGARRRSEGGSS